MKKINRTKKQQLAALLFTAALLSGCGTAATPEPTLDVNEFSTSMAQTLEADFTATALANPTDTPVPTETPTAMPTEEPASDSIVVLPMGDAAESGISRPEENSASEAINSALPILPAEGVLAAAQPTATIPAAVGDKATWEGQSPEDNTHIDAGAEFDITWYLRNTGTTTWTTDYSCRYFTNTNLTKRQGQRYNLQYNVAPGELGQCTIDAIAPEQPGTYKMAYVLSNEEDNNFYVVDITIIVD